jgi:hypothetical protein
MVLVGDGGFFGLSISGDLPANAVRGPTEADPRP